MNKKWHDKAWWVRVRGQGNLDSNITLPLALPRLKLFVWISLTPTYNSGIKQYFNYTKHFGKTGLGGVAYKCGKIASVSSDHSLFWDGCLILGLPPPPTVTASHMILAFRKTRNRQRWLQQDPPCLDCHLLFFGLDICIYIQSMDQWDTQAYWT